MKNDRGGRVALSFVSAGLVCLLASSASRAEEPAESSRVESEAENPDGQEVLIRGNVRMRRRAMAEPMGPREVRPAVALPDEEGRPVSSERIVSSNGSRWLADELIVGYRKGTTRRQKDQLRADRGFRRIAATRDKLSKLEVELVELPARLESSGLEALMADLRTEPSVEYVEPNLVIEDGGSDPRTTADLAEAILDAVDHGEDAFRFHMAGSEQARTVRDALVYARRNSGRVSGGWPVAPKTDESPIRKSDPVSSEPEVTPPPGPVYRSSRCGELAPFLREDATVRARIRLPGPFPLEALKVVERSGARVTHLLYRWNDNATRYPVSPGEDLDSAVKGLKTLRERFVLRQVESMADLVSELRPLNEEQERFREALAIQQASFQRERAELASGQFRIDTADILATGEAIRSIARKTSVRLESCTIRGDAVRGALSDRDVIAQVGPLLNSEQPVNVLTANASSLPAPSTWMPSMGVHRVDLRDSTSPESLQSYFWWNDTSGFNKAPHIAYEHDIRIDSPFLRCNEEWNLSVPFFLLQGLKLISSGDHVWGGEECSHMAIHSNLPDYYPDIRFYDNPNYRIFTAGTALAGTLAPFQPYWVVVDLKLEDSETDTAALTFEAQLGHWQGTYEEAYDWLERKANKKFCELNGQFCEDEPCPGEQRIEQACVFSSDTFKIIDRWNIKKGELRTLVWSANIGLYGGESEGKWLACRSDDTGPCGNAVPNINDKSTDRIRDVYYSYDHLRDGTYNCNKLGVPFDNGSGIYVHYWDGMRLQDFKHPAGTGCERFGNDGETAIVYNPAKEKAFLLRDGMWEKYRSIQGALKLGAPTGDEYELTGVGAQQNFERGCLIFYSSTGTVEQKEGAACAKPPLPDFRYAELGGLRVKSGSNRLEMLLRAKEAGLAATAGDFIDLEQVQAEVKKTFLQALSIPDSKHRISLNIVGSGGYADVPAPFERTDMADAFLHADVAMKFDLFGESGLAQETEIWTNLVQQSPYWSELNSKGFEEYPYWIIAATIIPGEVTATRTEDRIVVEDVELDLNAGWWWQEPTLDLSGYSLSAGARNDLLQRLATYKTTLQNIVKNYARDVVVPEMNRTENLDPRYKRLKSMYSAIALAQWYKIRAAQNPKLPLAGRVDSQNLTGIEKDTPFDQAYWNGQANQLLWSGPCTTFWGTAECEIFGGLQLADSEPAILRDLTPDQEQMMTVVLDDFGSVEEGDTHYLYGNVLTGSTAELSLGEIGFLAGPYLAGRPVTLQVRVLNTGITASGSFVVTVYDDVPGGQRHPVGQATLTLASMAATTASFPWTFPQEPGRHTFTVVVDSTQAVSESNESDNTGVRTLDVGSTSPTAEIQFPVEGSVFTAGDIPFFAGVGRDPEEGELAAGQIVWSSNLDGPLGTGPELEDIALSVGEHTITLTVSDSEGLSASDEIHIRIEPPALDYYTVVPCRVLDTRTGAPLASASTREFPIGNLCGVPLSARAVSINITAVTPTGTGYVTLWPAGIPRPDTSAISFAVGRTRASNMILPLAGDGSGLAAAEAVVAGSGSVHMVIDVTGYFE